MINHRDANTGEEGKCHWQEVVNQKVMGSYSNAGKDFFATNLHEIDHNGEELVHYIKMSA